MVTDEELDRYRVDGTKIRVVRDSEEGNDVTGIIVAWDEGSVLVRKQNRKVVKLSRDYLFQSAAEARPLMPE